MLLVSVPLALVMAMSYLVIYFILFSFALASDMVKDVSSVWRSLYHPDESQRHILDKVREQADVGDAPSRDFLRLHQLLKFEDKLAFISGQSSETTKTNLAFLLRHNLIKYYGSVGSCPNSFWMESDPPLDSKKTALTLFAEAAEHGDPLALIIMGEHFSSLKQCEKAVKMYRRASLLTLESLTDFTIAMFDTTRYVNSEDETPAQHSSKDDYDYLFYEAWRGNVDASYNLGLLLIGEDFDLPYDPDRAAEYFKPSIAAGNSKAMLFLAILHISGSVANPNISYARELLEAALSLGDYHASAHYARFLMDGTAGLKVNRSLAKEYLDKGVSLGNVDAMFLLGQMYATSKLEGDIKKASFYWQLPASFRHVFASWYLAEHYSNLANPVIISGHKKKTVPPHKLCEMSLPLYKRVAQSGGWQYILNDAYKDFKNQKMDSAALKYMLLSDLGYKVAHVNLARILQTPESITLYDSADDVALEEVVAWTRVARDGDPLGYLHLGHHFYYGSGGLNQDPYAAYRHYQKASQLFNGEATFNLGYMFEMGYGVDRDINEAIKIYTISKKLSNDSIIPSNLALARLYSFKFVLDHFSIDLYTVNSLEIFTSVIYTPEAVLGILMVILIVTGRNFLPI